jgi:hypothetical protein
MDAQHPGNWVFDALDFAASAMDLLSVPGRDRLDMHGDWLLDCIMVAPLNHHR